MAKKDFEGLDDISRAAARRAAFTATLLVFAAVSLLLLLYALTGYFGPDFWTLAAYALFAAAGLLLSRRRRNDLAVLLLVPATLAYLALDSWGVVGDPLGLALYLSTDLLGVVIAGIAAGFVAGPLGLVATVGAGGLVFTLIAAAGGARHLEAMIFANVALAVIVALVLLVRGLLLGYSRRATAAGEEARREAERAGRSAAEREEALVANRLLFRELQHRVKNNLQLISSLITLQSSAAADRRDARILEPARRRVHALALAHDESFASRDGSRVELRGLCRAVAEAATGDFGVELFLGEAAEPFYVDPGRATACALIVEELARNSLEHAAGAGAAVRLEIGIEPREDGGFRLLVRDNGPGLPPAEALRDSPGLGLRLVESLASQLGAEALILEDRSGMAFTVPGRA